MGQQYTFLSIYISLIDLSTPRFENKFALISARSIYRSLGSNILTDEIHAGISTLQAHWEFGPLFLSNHEWSGCHLGSLRGAGSIENADVDTFIY
jgi:hypothetical protein